MTAARPRWSGRNWRAARNCCKAKRLVIWEFVERDIRYGTEGWKLIPLPLLQAAREPDPERRDARRLQ